MNKKLLSVVMSGMVLTSSNFSLEAKAVDKLKSARDTAVNFVKNHKKLVIGSVVGAIATPIVTFAAVKAVKKIVSIDWNKNDKKSNNIQSLKSKILEGLSKDGIVKIDSLSVVEAREIKAVLESSGIKVVCNIPNLPNNAKGTLIIKNDPKKEVGAPQKVIMEFEILNLKEKGEPEEQSVEDKKSEEAPVEEKTEKTVEEAPAKAEVQEEHKDDQIQEKAVEETKEAGELNPNDNGLAELFDEEKTEETVEEAPVEEKSEEDITDPLGEESEEDLVSEKTEEVEGNVENEETPVAPAEKTENKAKSSGFFDKIGKAISKAADKVFDKIALNFVPSSDDEDDVENGLNLEDLNIRNNKLLYEAVKAEDPYKNIGLKVDDLKLFKNVKYDEN